MGCFFVFVAVLIDTNPHGMIVGSKRNTLSHTHTHTIVVIVKAAAGGLSAIVLPLRVASLSVPGGLFV